MTTRRQWLRRIGVALGGLTIGSQAATARPGNGNGQGGGPPAGAKNECPDGTTLLAIYNVDGGSFVFEKGRDSLNIDGSEIELTVTETKEEGEILAFEWDAGIYDIHTVSVKTGAGVFQQSVEATEGSFDVREYDSEGPVQAISNIIFCIKVHWQVDFGTGDVPSPPDYNAPPDPPALILAATGGDGDVAVNDPSAGPKNLPSSVSLDTSAFEIDQDDNTATIEFSVDTDGDAPDLHIASFETPGEFVDSADELNGQVLFDRVEADNLSTGAYSWTVDLPSL